MVKSSRCWSALALALCLSAAMAQAQATATEHRLVTLDPGHFHAALVQKTMIPGLSPQVTVYAPEGPDLDLHLQRIEQFNARAADPTHWEMNVQRGPDYLQRMLDERTGDIVIISGNNRRKAEYITRALEAGFNVYADKPMAIDRVQFEALDRAFDTAQDRGLLLYDIMTERYEITNILQRELAGIAEVFGEFQPGSAEQPAIVKESVHHFSKLVAGQPLQRPAWFFDAAQQGDGLVDVTTHLVDLVQWGAFPGLALDYERDIVIDQASHWPTWLNLAKFSAVTGLAAFPERMQPLVRYGRLGAMSNGRIDYRIRGLHARVVVRWEFQAPAGGGDTHYSEFRGTRASLVIRQGLEQGFVPELYIEPHASSGLDEAGLAAALAPLIARYPGLSLQPSAGTWRVDIPEQYRVGHEAHFAQVTQAFLGYLDQRQLPDWEVPNMRVKYRLTTTALAQAAVGE